MTWFSFILLLFVFFFLDNTLNQFCYLHLCQHCLLFLWFIVVLLVMLNGFQKLCHFLLKFSNILDTFFNLHTKRFIFIYLLHWGCNLEFVTKPNGEHLKSVELKNSNLYPMLVVQKPGKWKRNFTLFIFVGVYWNKRLDLLNVEMELMMNILRFFKDISFVGSCTSYQDDDKGCCMHHILKLAL